MTENPGTAPASAEDEVAALCSDLIRIDTTNRGDHSGPGERKAAEHVAALLAEAGLEAKIYESHPGRASVVARVEGTDSSRPALLIHGHLDVVPADPADWAVHPFSGELSGGEIWGRGAVDMAGAWWGAVSASPYRGGFAIVMRPTRKLPCSGLRPGGGIGRRASLRC